MAHSRSFLANQKARNAIVGAENLLIKDIPIKKKGRCTKCGPGFSFETSKTKSGSVFRNLADT